MRAHQEAGARCALSEAAMCAARKQAEKQLGKSATRKRARLEELRAVKAPTADELAEVEDLEENLTRDHDAEAEAFALVLARSSDAAYQAEASRLNREIVRFTVRELSGDGLPVLHVQARRYDGEDILELDDVSLARLDADRLTSELAAMAMLYWTMTPLEKKKLRLSRQQAPKASSSSTAPVADVTKATAS